MLTFLLFVIDSYHLYLGLKQLKNAFGYNLLNKDFEALYESMAQIIDLTNM